MMKLNQNKNRASRKPRLTRFGFHLVYSEGKKTEPNYVEKIKRIIDESHLSQNNKIIIKNADHSNQSTIGLVNYAIADVDKRLASGERIDHVWIFFDKDDFKKTNFNNAHKKIINRNKKNYLNDDGDHVDENNVRWHSLWSNECFELWVLLHFEFMSSNLPRKDYFQKLKKYIKYNKTMTNLYDILKKEGNVESAITFSKRLEKINGINNPSTGVYQLLEYFKLYLE